MKKSTWIYWALFLAAFAGAALISAAESADALTNQGVLTMVEAGLGEGLIISKIQQAKATNFALEVDDLIKLKSGGISEPVLQAMLQRESTDPWSGSSGGASQAQVTVGEGATSGTVWANTEDLGIDVIKVALSTPEGDTPIRILRGEMTTTAMGYMAFMNYPGLHARIRTTDRRPSLLVKSQSPLTGGRYFLGKLDSDKDDGVRSLKVSSVGGRMRSMFGNSKSFLEPDEDWTVPYTAEDLGNDLWRVTPDEVLKPGEYGWYIDLKTGPQEAGLFGFGVD